MKGKVVVPSVPENHLPFLFRLPENRLIIHSGVNHDPLGHQVFIFFPFFHRAEILVQVLHRGQALHAHPGEIAIGHGVADHHRLDSQPFQNLPDIFRNSALAASGSDGANGNDRHRGLQHRPLRPQQDEIRPLGEDPGSLVHHLFVGEIAVGEDDLPDLVVADDLGQSFFRQDGNSLEGKEGPDSSGGKRRFSIPGIWAAVKAATRTEGSSRKQTRKL